MTPQSSPTNKLPSDNWGFIVTPKNWGSTIPDDRLWCVDNQIFTGKFNEVAFWAKLKKMKPFRNRCKFVAAPDVVANAISTMNAFRYWGCRIKAVGWPVAFVAQDGQELYPFPPEFDALFIGGSTEWKMSDAALECIRRAHDLGKWVHVGRVNSQKRIAHFDIAGADSVDGTTICFAPDKGYRLIEKQLQRRALPFAQKRVL